MNVLWVKTKARAWSNLFTQPRTQGGLSASVSVLKLEDYPGTVGHICGSI